MYVLCNDYFECDRKTKNEVKATAVQLISRSKLQTINIIRYFDLYCVQSTNWHREWIQLGIYLVGMNSLWIRAKSAWNLFLKYETFSTKFIGILVVFCNVLPLTSSFRRDSYYYKNMFRNNRFEFKQILHFHIVQPILLFSWILFYYENFYSDCVHTIFLRQYKVWKLMPMDCAGRRDDCLFVKCTMHIYIRRTNFILCTRCGGMKPAFLKKTSNLLFPFSKRNLWCPAFDS